MKALFNRDESRFIKPETYAFFETCVKKMSM